MKEHSADGKPHCWVRAGLTRVLIAIMVMVIAFPAFFPQNVDAASDGMIRVRLTRLGSGLKSITLTTAGSYSINGSSSHKIGSGATVKAAIEGGKIHLYVNGTKQTTGSTLSLTRNGSGSGSGVRFKSPSFSNLFCGDLQLSISSGSLMPVLKIYIEDYLYGVVAYEMSNSFPLEALKAQAVVARTYAMRAKRSGGSYDLVDNANAQVFKGYNSSYGNVINAVKGTKGVCLKYGGSYARTYYTSSNGGQTESSANAWGGTNYSYLQVKDDPYDLANPSSKVKSHKMVKKPTASNPLNSKLNSTLVNAMAGQLKSKGYSGSVSDVVIKELVNVQPHTPRFKAPSKTYTKLKFSLKVASKNLSTDKTENVPGTIAVDVDTYGGLESQLGLSLNSGKNEIVTVDNTSSAFVLNFRRWGHGVGMSQRGAQQMAKQGKNYKNILSFYYPGTSVSTLSLKDTSGNGGSGNVNPPTGQTGYVQLKKGDKGDAVKNLQQKLKELGYFTGTPAGNYGDLTVAAVKRFQKALGEKQDGIASVSLQKKLFENNGVVEKPTTAPNQYKLLKKGNKGDDVKKLQQQLKKLGFFTGSPAGNYGTLTVSAVKRYQKALGLKQDGIASVELQKQLFSSDPLSKATPKPTATPKPSSKYKTLKKGSKGSEVKKLQKKLKELGYFTGNPAGNYGSLTVAAVKRFQKAKGLKQDGIATAALQEKLFSTGATAKPTATPKPGSSTSDYRKLKKGSKGNDVKALQKKLKELGYFTGTPAGNYGKLTVAAVKRFQKANGIKQDGIATASLQKKIFAAKGKSGSSSSSKNDKDNKNEDKIYARVKLKYSSSTLKVRKKASISAAVVTKVKHNAKVQVLSKGKTWWKIKANSKTGYVKKGYLKVIS